MKIKRFRQFHLSLNLKNDKQTATVRRNLLKQLDVLTVNDGFCHY